MVQERLSDLAIISTENEICKHLDYGDSIATFSEAKNEKNRFCLNFLYLFVFVCIFYLLFSFVNIGYYDKFTGY